jgi:hypothetical protein
MAFQAILALINAAIPTVGSLIVAIRGTNGQVSIGVLLDQADANFDKTITDTQAWLAAHPATTPAPKV